MSYSVKILEDDGCYEIGFNLYEQCLDKYTIDKPSDRYIDERLSNEYIKNMVFHTEYRKHFPFFIETNSSYGFINNAYQIGCDLFGLPHGECEYSDIMTDHCMDNLFLEFKITIGNKVFQIPNGSCYGHSHIGDWAMHFLTNTGYDEGYNRLYFKTKKMLDTFLIALILNQNSTYHILE